MIHLKWWLSRTLPIDNSSEEKVLAKSIRPIKMTVRSRKSSHNPQLSLLSPLARLMTTISPNHPRHHRNIYLQVQHPVGAMPLHQISLISSKQTWAFRLTISPQLALTKTISNSWVPNPTRHTHRCNHCLRTTSYHHQEEAPKCRSSGESSSPTDLFNRFQVVSNLLARETFQL